jgi:hypothetical protein
VGPVSPTSGPLYAPMPARRPAPGVPSASPSVCRNKRRWRTGISRYGLCSWRTCSTRHAARSRQRCRPSPIGPLASA